MRARAIVIIVAVFFGLAAAFMVTNYANRAKEAALKKTEATPVLVATKGVPTGLTLIELKSRKLVETKQVPREFVAEDAIASSDTLSKQVVSVPLSAGEQLTEGNFSAPADAGLSYTTPDDMVSVAIPINNMKSAGDLIKIGNYVNIVGTADQGEENSEKMTKTILQKVRVLAIDKRLESEGTVAGSSGSGLTSSRSVRGRTERTVTLAVTQADGEKLIFVQEEGNIWLTLLPSVNAKTVSTDGQTFNTVFE